MKKVICFWMFCMVAFVTLALMSCSSDEGEEMVDLSSKMYNLLLPKKNRSLVLSM